MDNTHFKPGSSSGRNRFTREASQLLTDYVQSGSAYPSKPDKMVLLERIRALPGNEFCTYEKLSSWFARHRIPCSRTGARERSATGSSKDTPSPTAASPMRLSRLVDDDSILFPKLTPMQLQQLQVLYKNRPVPAEGVITFWANRIGAEREEVAAWIQYQQEKAKEAPRTAPRASSGSEYSPNMSPTELSFSRTHLPTPGKSPSPQARMLSLPPIAVKEEEQGHTPSPVVQRAMASFAVTSPVERLASLPPITRRPDEAPVSHTVPPSDSSASIRQQEARPSADQPRVPPAVRSEIDTSLLKNLKSALASSAEHRDCGVPSTAAEFDAVFRPYEDKIHHFMNVFSSGQLKHLGWDPSPGDH